MTKDQVQEDALGAVLGHRCSGIALGTGVGKTRLGLMYIDKHFSSLKKKVLIVAPKRSVFEEWKNQAEQFKLDKLLCNADYSTYISLIKHDPRDYDIVILDECHSLLKSHEAFLSNYNGLILGLTGTPPVRHYTDKAKLVAKYCPIRYTYLVDEAVSDDLLNDYKIIVHTLTLGTAKNVEVQLKNKPSFWTSEKDNYAYWTNRLYNSFSAKEKQINSIMRMKALMTYRSKELYAEKLIKHIGKSGDKLIIFANTQEQADKLCSHSYHSKNDSSEENLELFKTGQIKELSCVLQLSEGINIPELRQGLILHSYGNERKSSQRIGRLLRLNPDDQAVIHILCYEGTVDEQWVTEALAGLDNDKIIWKNFNISLY